MFQTPGSRPIRSRGAKITTSAGGGGGPFVAFTINAGNVTPNFATGSNFVGTLTLNASTLQNPTGGVTAGSSGVFVIKQPGTAQTLAYGNQYFFDGDTSPTIGTTINKSSVFSWLAVDSTHILITLVAVNSSVH